MKADEQDWFCPSSPSLPNQDWETWFTGSIGGVGARMHLVGGGGIAKGEFYRLNDWKPVILGGRLQAEGTLLLHDEQESGCAVHDDCAGSGVLRGRLTKTGFTGSWQASPGDPPKAIRMQAEPAPKCEVKGPKRVFSNPAWPVTFEYPATWHVDVTVNTVTLTCPDPYWMASEGANVSLTMGDLTPNGKLPSDPPILSELAKDDKGNWQYASDLGGGPEPATVVQRDGMTIITAAGSRRGYCVLGGYSGLEDTELALILFKGHWPLVEGGPNVQEITKLVVKGATLRKQPLTPTH